MTKLAILLGLMVGGLVAFSHAGDGKPAAGLLLELASGRVAAESAEKATGRAGDDSDSLNDQGVQRLLSADEDATGRALLQQAAERGSSRAAYNLGLAHALGLGGGVHWAEAARWFRQAAEHGHHLARYRLALLHLEGKGAEWDMARAADLFRQGAEQGHPLSQYWMGRLHEEGRGLEQDTSQAAVWYGKAGKGGHREAAYRLGLLFDQGDGVKRDPNQATAWFRKAAEAGHPESQYYLALAMERGLGAKRDLNKALAWYQKAAEAGHLPSQNNYAILLAGLEQDYQGALAWFQHAAENGNTKAQNNLGLMYLSGIADVRNNVLAMFWFSLAAAGGETGALENRNLVASRMSQAQLAEADQLVQAWRQGFDLPALPKLIVQAGPAEAGSGAQSGIIGLANTAPVMRWPPGSWPPEVLDPDRTVRAMPKGKENTAPARFND